MLASVCIAAVLFQLSTGMNVNHEEKAAFFREPAMQKKQSDTSAMQGMINRNSPPENLDLEVSDHLLQLYGLHGPDLINHLQSQGLYQKETGITHRNLESVLPPRYLNAVLAESQRNPELQPKYETQDEHPHSPHSFLKDQMKMSDLRDLDEMLKDEYVHKTLNESPEKSAFFFHLKNYFKEIQDREYQNFEQEPAEESSTGSIHPGVLFNLKTLEAELKQKLEDKDLLADVQSENTKDNIFFNLVGTLKEYVGEKIKVEDEEDEKSSNEQNILTTNAANLQNTELLRDLKANNNVEIKNVDEEGGILFKLEKNNGIVADEN